ncbi:exodeoxyribonuclease VII small subunit [Natronincola peptidivorans]|nr:exodeoxyribonuclease VII small subunit [Natronincola peptidivorans]
MDYEKAIKRLQEIIEQLENKELSLDDSLKLFQEGIELYRCCNTKLNNAEEKILMIVEENGVTTTTPFLEGEQ